MPPWFEFWAKARPSDDVTQGSHPFMAHALDVAAVAIVLPRPLRHPVPRQTLGFLVSLHDIGKLSRAFQAKVPARWPTGALGEQRAQDGQGPRHDEAGYRLLQHHLAEHLHPVLPPRQPGVRG